MAAIAIEIGKVPEIDFDIDPERPWFENKIVWDRRRVREYERMWHDKYFLSFAGISDINQRFSITISFT